MDASQYEDFDQLVEAARSLLSGHQQASDLWQANECINRALSLRPDNVTAWLVKSQIHSALEDDAAALAAAEMAVGHAPTRAEAHYVRAAVLADWQRYTEALQAIEHSFQHIQANEHWLLEELYFEKAAILDALDRCEEAMSTFELGLSRCPDSALLKSGLEPLRREHVRRAFRVIDGGRLL